ncbi:flagellar basal body rod protein FlgC [Rhodovibrio sodomensis]|uniref:Flagellar basal-body rod protein FlgC n=1 Tax=Rhodovibrio sodomensis TaxID=1088 RepID=A0ABS1DDN0_9PROT|nr:flagellar basal body rod protein FlgC [Rhodovibrio sodomensis]MBK1668563.1 flagellar basal body rod protein FlgC [Rhodovibrio sodomensis]
MDLAKTLHISAAGMKAQGVRLRVLSENVANADSVARTPDGEPYRRKLVTFANEMNKELGIHQVKIDKIETDRSAFGQEYRPGHPAADDQGYIKTPNVNSLIEMSDMREAQRSYEANLKVIESSRTMLSRTIDLLR